MLLGHAAILYVLQYRNVQTYLLWDAGTNEHKATHGQGGVGGNQTGYQSSTQTGYQTSKGTGSGMTGTGEHVWSESASLFIVCFGDHTAAAYLHAWHVCCPTAACRRATTLEVLTHT